MSIPGTLGHVAEQLARVQAAHAAFVKAVTERAVGAAQTAAGPGPQPPGPAAGSRKGAK